MKKASELGLTLLKSETGNFLVKGDRFVKIPKSNNGEAEIPEGWVIEIEDLIASTVQIGSAPLLIILSEAQKEWEELANSYHHRKEGINPFAFVTGYNKAKVTYRYTEADLRRGIAAGLSIGYSAQFNIDNQKEEIEKTIQAITKKELWIEVDFYYHSSKEFYDDKADWVICDEDQFNSLKTEIPSCPLKMEPKITNNQLKAIWK